MAGLDNPFDEHYCAGLETVLTMLGVNVPHDYRRSAAERIHELLALVHSWVLKQLMVVDGEVDAGVRMAAYTRSRDFLHDSHPKPADLWRIPAALVAQAEVLLVTDAADGMGEAVRELTAASHRAFIALLANPAEAEHLELVAYDETGGGQHTYAPAGSHLRTEAAELAFSAAVRLSAEAHA